MTGAGQNDGRSHIVDGDGLAAIEALRQRFGASIPAILVTAISVVSAIVLAQKGARVLIIDADLRRPTLHALFGVKNQEGLSDYILNDNVTPPFYNPIAALPNLFLLTAGSLGDRLGRRRVFTIGFGVFTGASFLCGLSGDPTLLNLARGLQGIGGAMMFGTSATSPFANQWIELSHCSSA